MESRLIASSEGSGVFLEMALYPGVKLAGPLFGVRRLLR
jgi:hypothetical protein